MNVRLTPFLALFAVGAASLVGPASAARAIAPQLKLPGKTAEPSKPTPGHAAPHYVCLACQSRNYVVVSNPRLDADGNTITWCPTCKRDTSQRFVAADPAPGETRATADERLKLPPTGAASQAPAPAGAKPIDAKPNDALPAESPAARLVFEGVRTARGDAEGLQAQAVESLTALGEPGFAAARRELASEDPKTFAVAARTLLAGGDASDLEIVRQRLRGKCPPNAHTIVAAFASSDPVLAGPVFLAELLEHPQANVRQEAEKLLRRTRGEERLKLLEPRLASKRAETRLAAVSLVSDSRAADATDALLQHLADPSPKVAAAVVQSLCLREDEDLDARLVGIAFKNRWILRTEAYALLAIVEREDARLKPILDATHADALLGGLEAADPLVRGASAAALAGIGFRSTDAQATAWLDRDVVDRLVDAVSGRTFFDDYSSLAPSALRRLKFVSGESIANDGPRWVQWWIAVRSQFWARRAALRIAPEEVGGFALRVETTGQSPEHFTLVGPDAAKITETTTIAGDIVYLTLDETRALVDLAQHEGLFGAELLPGSRGGQGRGERTLSIGVGGRAKSFKLGPGVSEPWFERTLVLARTMREQNGWQRFPKPGVHKTALDLWRAESPWWREQHTPLERALRLKQLVRDALPGASPALRDAGVAELERIAAEPGAIDAADFASFRKLIAEETHAGDRSHRLVMLAIAAARLASRDDKAPPPPDLGSDLLETVLARFGERAGPDLDAIVAACGPGFARDHARDPRPLVRASVARVLASEPTEENVKVLLSLLGDTDPSVEIAAVEVLGEARVEAARTDLLVRARLGLAPVRTVALVAVGKLGGEFVLDALVLGVGDRERAVRVAAARGLAELGDPAATSVLVSLLADDRDADIYGAAREGLKKLGSRALPDLLRLVHSPAARGRREAALLLAEQGSPDAASPLMSILSATPNDSRVAGELAILTCIDHRGGENPPQAWWDWWDGVRHDDSLAWFRAGVERVGMSAPGPGALEGAGTPQGRAFLLAVMERPEAWLAERARREFGRLTGADPGGLPARGPERDAWLRGLRTKLEEGRF